MISSGMIKRYFFSAIQKSIEFFRHWDHGVHIYMFHEIENAQNGKMETSITISPENFRRFIKSLLEKGKVFIPVEEIGNAPSDAVCVTFDDVFESAYENAFPFLIEKKIPFCVFVCSNLLDRPGYISTEQLLCLAKEPLCTIGFHTKNHFLMRKLSKEETFYEIDSTDFNKQFDIDTQLFAFPFGSLFACSNSNRKIVKHSNYTFAFSTLSMACTKNTLRKNPFFIPRINVNEANYRDLLKRIFHEDFNFFG